MSATTRTRPSRYSRGRYRSTRTTFRQGPTSVSPLPWERLDLPSSPSLHPFRSNRSKPRCPRPCRNQRCNLRQPSRWDRSLQRNRSRCSHRRCSRRDLHPHLSKRLLNRRLHLNRQPFNSRRTSRARAGLHQRISESSCYRKERRSSRWDRRARRSAATLS